MTGEVRNQAWAATHPWVRPYVMTGGRVHAPWQVPPHVSVSAHVYDRDFAVRLAPESGRLYERAHYCTAASGAGSLTGLSVDCGVPLGVARILLSDLAAAGRVQLGSAPETYPRDVHLLERIIDGLRQLA
ncbi:DUF742 domain-containing protein [Actinomadura sp. CNU-125]|uniref:DUF742 domain-containing protein n=1 Tax=Actinomadura sp. CNU-125 TaxID=1904961 RepID=UPI0009FAD698|nr:DUF742 domain-containing protein [Actinomadura sp. CNU-125]